MAVHRTFCQLKADMPAASTALFGFDERQIHRIGDKVSLHQQTLLLALISEVIRFAGKAAKEVMLGSENKFRIFEHIH